MKKMRRTDKEMSRQDTIDLLTREEHGILSTVGEDGRPYGTPLNYVYRDNAIYFHCALTGHKLDNIMAEKRVSFCVVGNAKVLPDRFATLYESGVVFGEAEEVHGEERFNALLWLLEKYSPDFLASGKEYIRKHDKATRVIKIDIDHMSGKAAR